MFRRLSILTLLCFCLQTAVAGAQAMAQQNRDSILDSIKDRFSFTPRDLGGDPSHRRISTTPYPADGLMEMLKNPEMQKLLKEVLPKESKDLEKLQKDLDALLKNGMDPELQDRIQQQQEKIKSRLSDLQASNADGGSGLIEDLMERMNGLDNLQEFRDRNLLDGDFLKDFLDADPTPDNSVGKTMQNVLDRVRAQTGDVHISRHSSKWTDWIDVDLRGMGDSFLNSFGNFGSLLPGIGPGGGPAGGLGHPAFGAFLLLFALGAALMMAMRYVADLSKRGPRLRRELRWLVAPEAMSAREHLAANYLRLTDYLLGAAGAPLSHEERRRELTADAAGSDDADAANALFEIAFYTKPEVELSREQYDRAAQALLRLSKLPARPEATR